MFNIPRSLSHSSSSFSFQYVFSFSSNGSDSKPPITHVVAPPPPPRRLPVVILESDLEWTFTKGTGPGGQSVNKTSNCATVKHIPSGITAKSHASRELETNKHYCRRQLSIKLDEILNGSQSKAAVKDAKKKKQETKRKKRSQEKYENKAAAAVEDTNKSD